VTSACRQCGKAANGPELEVKDVAVVVAGAADERAGLLGWAQLQVGPLLLAGLSVRRNVVGELTVTFPARRDRRGALHRQITPLDPDLDGRIRAAVITAYIEERTRRPGQHESHAGGLR
jgi:hypothetical protein